MEIINKKISELKPYKNNPRDNSKAIEEKKKELNKHQ